MSTLRAALAGSSPMCAFTLDGVKGDVAVVALRGEHDEIVARLGVNAADARRLVLFFGLVGDEIPLAEPPSTVG